MAFVIMNPELQQLFWRSRLLFTFTFGRAKAGLYIVTKLQSVSEEVLRTVLLEVEAIVNSKPSGNTSSNIADTRPSDTKCPLDGAA